MKFVAEAAKNQYPSELKKRFVTGRAFVLYVVNEEGLIQNSTIVKSSENEQLDSVAIQIMKSLPRYVPGMQEGKPVKVQYTVPVNFK